MEMQLLEKVRETTDLTNYGLSKALRDIGVEITTQGLDHYDKSASRSMRLDVLSGLYRLCAKEGVTEKQFLTWVNKEFGA